MTKLIENFLNWGVFLNCWTSLLNGVIVTLEMALICLVTAMILGLLVALLKVAKIKVVSAIMSIYINIFRGTPLLVQIMVIFYAFPYLGLNLARWPAAILSLTLNSGAFIAEVFRGGIESIPKGQYEAAQSLGMSYTQTMSKIILPQAFKRSLPALTNCFVALLKDTSLVSVIGVVELLKQGRQLQTWQANATPLMAAAIIYFIVIWPFVKLSDTMEKRMKKS